MINCHSFKISRIEHTSISSNKGSVDCTDVFRNQIFKGKQMNRFESVTKPLMWLMALLLTALVAGCGGGSQDPILGGGGAGVAGVVPPVPPIVAPVAPGLGNCLVAVAGDPQILSSNPTDGNLNVTISTTDPATNLPGPNKLITATFSLPMNPLTITPVGTFTLKDMGVSPGALPGTNVPGTVTMNVTNVANTIATFTTPALTAGNSYTATITQTAATPGGITLACVYEWSFTTAAIPPSGLGAVDLGLASSFGIASYAGLTNTGATKINGNTLIGPTNTCNGVVLLNSDGPGFGACGAGGPPTNNPGDVVITPVYDQGITSAAIFVDLRAAYVSLSPPAAAPAGPLGPGTTILAPTTLGTGSTGANTFTPGLYTDLAAGIQIQGDLTLNGGGDPDAVFIFQTAGSLTTINPTRILLTGGAKASNVWWQVGSSAIIGVGTEFQGNILADTSITLLTGATSCGRLLAGAFTNSGAFTFDTNIVAVPGQPFAPGGARSTTCQ